MADVHLSQLSISSSSSEPHASIEDQLNTVSLHSQSDVVTVADNNGDVGDRNDDDGAEEREKPDENDGDHIDNVSEKEENEIEKEKEEENSSNYNYDDNCNNRDDNISNDSSSKRIRYPVREEAEDCAFYMKTGMCKFGMICKFNHPPNRKPSQGGKVIGKEEYADDVVEKGNGKDDFVEKEGRIDCKYFDRPGGCKFGKACKFNHSRKPSPTLVFNFLGLPIRQGEKECPFYMRNGSCKFGASCRFNHPDPTSVGGPDALTGYSNGGSISPPSASQWSPPAALNESHAFVPLMFPPTHGVPSRPEWSAYRAPVYPPERSVQMAPTYAMNSQVIETNVYTHQPEQILVDEFPERPGQPECSFFVKTGTCKYRSACKFHHPKKVTTKSPSYSLSDLGLPLRPGVGVCSYYNRYGICKYGPACKYDHPVNHAHSAALAISAVDLTPGLGNSMVNNQAMAAGCYM